MNQTKYMIEILSTPLSPWDSIILFLEVVGRSFWIRICCSVKRKSNKNIKIEQTIIFWRKMVLEINIPQPLFISLYKKYYYSLCCLHKSQKFIQAYQIQCWFWITCLGHQLKTIPIFSCLVYIHTVDVSYSDTFNASWCCKAGLVGVMHVI